MYPNSPRDLEALSLSLIPLSSERYTQTHITNVGRVQSRLVGGLSPAQLACPPTVQAVVMQLQSQQGRNISFKCSVTGQGTPCPFFNLML